MFGLENKKKGDPDTVLLYDIEEEIQNITTYRKHSSDNAVAIRELKNLLAQGYEQADYEHITTLLQGYVALKRVCTRARKNNKTK